MEFPVMGRKKWLYIFGACIILSVWLAYLTENYSTPEPLKFMVNNFGGNLMAGILGGFQFLFLAFYLDAQTDENIDRIKETVITSENLITRREKILEQEQMIFRFEQFLKNENWHNIRFPDLKNEGDNFGLEYKIRPVRDSETNEPTKYEKEMGSYYLIKIDGPPHALFMSKEEKVRYSKSPIKDNHFYFCQFINDSWCMGESAPFEHRFYLSGKVGPVEHSISANQFMADRLKPLEEKELVAEWYLNENGSQPAVGEGGMQFRLFKGSGSSLYLTIQDSLPKLIYYTTPKDTYGDQDWYLVIEDMRGYAHGERMSNITASVEASIKTLNLTIPKVPWFQANLSRI